MRYTDSCQSFYLFSFVCPEFIAGHRSWRSRLCRSIVLGERSDLRRYWSRNDLDLRDDVGSGLLTAKNDPSAHSLFQDALLDETAKLGIVRARFEDFDKSSFDELIAGYSSMKVLTYSSSASIINRAAEEMERLEIVFGRPDILGDMASYLHFQELLLKELIDATRGKDFIKEKIESGAIMLHVVQDIISHEKLFLLEGEAGTRVITGSANFAERAFSGAQNDSDICST